MFNCFNVIVSKKSVGIRSQFELYHSLLTWNRFFAILTYILYKNFFAAHASFASQVCNFYILTFTKCIVTYVPSYKSHLCTVNSIHRVYSVVNVFFYTILLSILFQLQWRGNWWPILYLCLQARSASTSSFRSLSQVHTKIIYVQIYIHMYTYIVEKLVTSYLARYLVNHLWLIYSFFFRNIDTIAPHIHICVEA